MVHCSAAQRSAALCSITLFIPYTCAGSVLVACQYSRVVKQRSTALDHYGILMYAAVKIFLGHLVVLARVVGDICSQVLLSAGQKFARLRRVLGSAYMWVGGRRARHHPGARADGTRRGAGGRRACGRPR